MTEGIREYLISVCAAAILTVLIPALISHNRIRRIAEFAGGLMLLVAVMVPIVRLDLSEFRQILSSYLIDDASIGTISVPDNEFLAERISEQCEEYILDKAEDFGMSVEVKVRVNDASPYPMPIGVSVIGRFSLWQRDQLSAVIKRDLGVPVEQQEWNIR